MPLVVRRYGARRLVAASAAVLFALTACTGGPSSTPRASPPPPRLSMRVLATGLANPWEVTWGPDGMLWITEKAAGRVTRMSPGDGTSSTALVLPDLYADTGAQDGLLGMALHPSLLKQDTDQYVYLTYTYNAADSAAPVDRRMKIVRYEYDRGTQKLVRPKDLLTGLPAGIDHDSGRLAYGPDNKLYFSIGDMGHNQFDSTCLKIQSQTLPTAAQVQARNWSAYQGKVLRLNLDGSIPTDNPVLAGVRSHVYSYGHRNAQGLVFGSDGTLYSSEQGPKTDDELNVIVAGGNYGWPRVAGYKDDRSYAYGNWSASQPVRCGALTYSDFSIPESVPLQRESTFDDPAFVPPRRTFSTVPEGYDFRLPACTDSYFVCWPTVAPSSLDYYPATGTIPGWGPSLLMPSLKNGTVYRLPLNPDGVTIGEPLELWRTVNRYRDIAIAPDNRTFYVATDAGGLARDANGLPTNVLANPAAILEFRYTGS
ncbi:MAG: gdhB [Sphaerisporangium sp.]|jgi:PQQ-dependent dehydrogenase (s-GDH family)|nr:gdhB [Sphaerisporangium sp.]